MDCRDRKDVGAALKAWQAAFVAAHGRPPSRKDIAAAPRIGTA
jgi:hypothetical protein